MIDPVACFPFSVERTSLEPLEFRTSWTVPAGLPYFDGHFPNMPVLPAVAIIDASAEFLRLALSPESSAVKTVPTAKFLRPVLPDQKVEIHARQISASEWSVEWREPGTGAPLSALKIQLRLKA